MDEQPSLTPEEIVAFARKLDAWAQELPPAEEHFLARMLADAADTAGDSALAHHDFHSLHAQFQEDPAAIHQPGEIYESIVAYGEVAVGLEKRAASEGYA